MSQEILNQTPQCLRIAKLALSFESDRLWPASTHARELLAMTHGNPETMEGIRAFLEKRTPDYRQCRRQRRATTTSPQA